MAWLGSAGSGSLMGLQSICHLGRHLRKLMMGGGGACVWREESLAKQVMQLAGDVTLVVGQRSQFLSTWASPRTA